MRGHLLNVISRKFSSKTYTKQNFFEKFKKISKKKKKKKKDTRYCFEYENTQSSSCKHIYYTSCKNYNFWYLYIYIWKIFTFSIAIPFLPTNSTTPSFLNSCRKMFSFQPNFVADRISTRSWENMISCSLI